jgi:hypothetical protein
VQFSGDARFRNLQASYSPVGWNAALTEHFEDAWFEGALKDAAEPGVIEGRANSCASASAMLLDTVAWDRGGRPLHEVPIWQFPNSRSFFFVSGMTIDADGAPNAFKIADTGLDELANAGTPAH